MECSLKLTDFIRFLQDELAISSSDIAVVLRRRQQLDDPSSSISHVKLVSFGIDLELPMLLWQYGLVSLEQLQQIFDWLANQPQLNLLADKFPVQF